MLFLTTSALIACHSPSLVVSDLLKRDADQFFQSIETIDLNERSRTPPVSLDEASAKTTGVEKAVSEETLEIDLDEVRRATLANNLDLELDRISPEIAREGVESEEARFDAVIGAVAGVQGSESRISNVTNSSESYSFDPSVRIPLRTGGTVSVGLPWGRSDASGVSASESLRARASISQPLLRNAGVAINTAPILSAKIGLRRTEARVKVSAMRVLASAERAYWDHWATTRDVETQHAHYKTAVKQLERAQRLVEAGVLAEVEIQRSEAGVSRRLDAIIRAENARRRTERALKRVMNRPDLPVDSSVALIPVTAASPLGLDLDRKKLTQFALENRMELVQVELQMLTDAIETGLAENGLLPIVAFDLSYSFQGRGRQFSDAIDRLLDVDDRSWSASVSGSIPLGNRAARSRFRRALLRRKQTLVDRKQTEQQIRLDISNAVDGLEQAWQRILAARLEVSLAETAFGAEERQFQAGLRTSTEVLEAAGRLADARTREIDSFADYQIALVDVALATGTLIGHSRIRWD